MSRTARDVVRDSLALLRVYGRGMDLDADDAARGLGMMNDMLASWAAEGSNVPVLTKQTATLTAGQQDYTVGVGQQLAITRPVRIEAATLISGGNRYPLEQHSMAEHAKWFDDDSNPPGFFAYDYQGAVGNLRFNAPPDVAYTLEIWGVNPFTEVGSLNTNLLASFDRGDVNAIKYGLAVDMAPEFGREPSQVVIARAKQYRDDVAIRYSEPLRYERGRLDSVHAYRV